MQDEIENADPEEAEAVDPDDVELDAEDVDLEVDDVDVEEEAEEASLEGIFEDEADADTPGTALNDDEYLRAVLEVDEEESTEGIAVPVAPKRPGEFTCSSCFLVKHPSQLADPKGMLCTDCA